MTITITPEEAADFLTRGRQITTNLASALDTFEAYARSFEARGGAAALGEVGDDVLQIITLHNQLAPLITPSMQATMDTYRLDY